MDSTPYLVTGPAFEPVTLDEAKLACHVDAVEDDIYLTRLILSARMWAEEYTRRALVTQTWELRLDGFPRCPIELPWPPLASVTSIKYLDTAGVLQTGNPTDYLVTGAAARDARGTVRPTYGTFYPSTSPVPEAVQVRYVAGYGDPTLVPAGVKHGILLHIAESYGNREAPDYSAAKSSLWPWYEGGF